MASQIVHSGPEPERHGFDARVSETDLVDTYLPAFRATVVEGHAASVMCVYNAVKGVPGCASTDLLQTRLRDEWRFTGYVVSDCGAVGDILRGHHFTPTRGGAAVAAVKAGTDLTCGTEYKTAQMTSTAAAPSSRRPVLATARLETGHPYRVRVEFRQTGTGGIIQLAWIPPAMARWPKPSAS